MATPSQIKQQFQLEKEAISCGKMKLHASLKKLEEKSYASASVYGVSSIATALPLVIKELESTKRKLRNGQAGKFYRPIAEYVDELAHLQSNAPAMGWLFVKRRMVAELSPHWEKKFKSFEHDAAAAASLIDVPMPPSGDVPMMTSETPKAVLRRASGFAAMAAMAVAV